MLLEQRVGGKRDRGIIHGIAVVTICVGLLVMLGWIVGVPQLTSIYPTLVTMKFVTAICFVLCGLSLFGLRSLLDTDPGIALTTLPILAFTILLLMGGLIPAMITGAGFGIETFFVTEPSNANFTTISGVPAISTVICFTAIAVMILLVSYRTEWIFRASRWTGSLVGFIGSMVLVGYIFRVPLLQTYIAGVSTAMALHTAVLFILIGIALLLLSRGFEAHVNERIPTL
jgi:hypothetical protein